MSVWSSWWPAALDGEWAMAFLLTLAIEVPVYMTCSGLLGWWATGRTPGGGRGTAPKRAPDHAPSRPDHALGWSLAVNLTHPLLWLAAPPTLALLVVAEALVAAVEGLAWCWAWWHRGVRDRLVAGGLVTAGLANALSWLTGILLFA